MQKVIMISRDPKVLDTTSDVYKRVTEYGALFDELHVVVMGKSPSVISARNSCKIYLYNTTSRFKIFSFFRTLGASMGLGWKMKKVGWVTSQDPFEAGIVAVVVAKLCRLKLQLQLHTDVFSYFYPRVYVGNFFRTMLARIIIPSADSLRVVSQKMREHIIERKLLPWEKIFVLPVFVDTHALASKQQAYDLKEKYPDFEKIILIVARLEREKNLSLVLEVFRKIIRILPEAGLVIIGDGTQARDLKVRTERLGIASRVRFEGWSEDTTSAYKTADLLLVTSFYEGYGMNIIEALACGCPVVSTDVGIAREAGALIANYDAGELAIKCTNLLKSSVEGELTKEFVGMSKQEYLNKYKETFS